MQKIKMQLHWKRLINVRCLPFVSFVVFYVSSIVSSKTFCIKLEELRFFVKSNHEKRKRSIIRFVVILFFDLNIMIQCLDIVFCYYSVLMFWHVKQQVICMWEYLSYSVLANDSFVLFFSNTINLGASCQAKNNRILLPPLQDYHLESS